MPDVPPAGMAGGARSVARGVAAVAAALILMAGCGGRTVPGSGASTPAATPDTAPPQVKDITLSPDAVSVTGLDIVTVTVSVRLTDQTGVGSHPGSPDAAVSETPTITFTRRGGGTQSGPHGLGLPTRNGAVLKLASGSARDGIWTGNLVVPSTHHGTWHPTSVYVEDTVPQRPNTATVDPGTIGLGRTLTVTGTHQPRMTMEFRPERERASFGEPVRVQGRAYYADTHGPIAGRTLVVGYDNTCVEYGIPRVHTDAHGRYRHTWPEAGPGVYCVLLTAPELSPSGDLSDVAVVVGRTDCLRPGGTGPCRW